MPQPVFIPVADIFSAAINILQDKSKFCQNYYYVDADGNSCDLPNAVAFDASGVIQYIIKEDDPDTTLLSIMDYLMIRIFKFMYGQSVPLVNDLPDGYERVLAALSFARYLWQDREPDDIDLYSSVEDILEKINESEML